MTRSSLSIMHQIGQRMMVGFEGPRLDDKLIRLVRTYKIGNFVLFSWNITGKQQMMQLCRDIQELVLQETGRPAWIAIDQEGGAVSRLPDDATLIPGAMAIAATGDPANAYKAGCMTGEELWALGANLNLAPVLDINSNAANPVIGVRSYGDSPETVIRYSLRMMQGLHDGGVLSCGKHFPGHGDTSVDSHLALPTVNKPLEELQRMEFMPFQAAIDAGLPAIMSSHIVFPQLDPDVPATMSRRILTDLLRKQMGFEGLILTDCLEMQAIQQSFGTVKGALEAIKAGADLVLISHTASLAEAAATAIREALLAGDINKEEWSQSLQNIEDLKAQYLARPGGDPDAIGCESHKEANMAILRQTITAVNVPGGRFPVLGDRPSFIGSPPFRSTLVSSITQDGLTFPVYMAEQLGGQASVTSPNPDADEIAEIKAQTAGSSCIVVGTYNSHLHAGQQALVNELAATDIPVIAIALRNPYDLKHVDRSVYTIAAYEYTAQMFDALALVLQGKATPTGKASVSVTPI